MSWSQQRHSEDLYEQIVILVGSAIRLLRGQAGVFVLANAAFDPQSSSEYTLYQLSESEAASFLNGMRERALPGPVRPLVVETLPPALATQLEGISEATVHEAEETLGLERRSFFVSDAAGALGILHCLCPLAGEARAPLAEDDQQIVLAQLAAGLRASLRAQVLVKEQQRLAAIFHQSAEGILSVDAALRILDFNPAMERLTGWHEHEVVGRFYVEVLRPKDRQGHDLGLQGSPILQAFAGQRVENREMSIDTRDGQQFAVSVNASCIYAPYGEPTIGILTVRDISREREQEEQRSTFISVISHELQTPIAIIKGYASTLARGRQSALCLAYPGRWSANGCHAVRPRAADCARSRTPAREECRGDDHAGFARAPAHGDSRPRAH